MESKPKAIVARELTKRFGDFTAVDHVSFEVEHGELFGLLGPNGAGKTTLTRMLTTLLVPTSGQGLVASYDVARAPHSVRESIGVIPQALTSDLDLTGRENLDVYGQFYGIARGLIHSPEVLFLDEPTIGLDPQSRRAVWDLLERLREETGLTISLTTHYMDEAETLCDRVAIVDGGKIIALGTPAELKAMVKGSDRIELEFEGDAEPAMTMLRQQPYVFELQRDPDGTVIVSTDDGAQVMPKLVSDIETVGARLHSIRLERMSLEDVFIRFTGRRLRDEAARKLGFFGPGMPRPSRPF